MNQITPLSIAIQLIGTKELDGSLDNPLIVAMIQCCDPTQTHDEVPWCSGMTNFIAKLSNLPRSKSLAAKSWLGVGTVISIDEAVPGFDIVIFNRTTNPSLGHVGFFNGIDEHAQDPSKDICIVSGNVDNTVTIQNFARKDIAGVRRLA